MSVVNREWAMVNGEFINGNMQKDLSGFENLTGLCIASLRRCVKL
jgi:hypothetical protein